MSLMIRLEKQKEILESQGYKVCYIAVYGSQNYKLEIYSDDYRSDLDMKAIIVPTLDDLINNSKPVSEVVETEWGECDIKDIRSYFEILLKANPSYIETLFTNYYIVDDNFIEEFKTIRSLREDLVGTLGVQMIRAMYGMMLEKQKAMCHPYPSIADKIEKFGYDGKQVHHALRLLLMMEDFFINNKPMSECFVPQKDERITLKDLKLNKYPLRIAESCMDDFIKAGKVIRDTVLEETNESKIDYSIKERIIRLSQDIIKSKIIQELRS